MAPGPIPPRLIQPSERPSRWRLTYAFELQLWSSTLGSSIGISRMVGLGVNPESTSVDVDFAAKITDTAGGVGVDESGFTRSEIVVEGNFGLAVKRGWTAPRFSGVANIGTEMISADGNRLWRELRQLFRVYADQNRNGGQIRARMIWHDFRNDDHWVVIPTKWSMDRNAAEHRLHYPYRIEMTAVGDDDAGAGFGTIGNALNAARNGLATAIDYINQAAGYVEDVTALVDEANGVIKVGGLGVLNAVGRIGSLVGNVRTALGETLNIPYETAVAWRNTVEAWRSLIDTQLDLSDPWTPVRVDVSRLAAQYETAARLSDALHGLTAAKSAFRTGASGRLGTHRRLAAGERAIGTAEALAGAGVAPGSISARATAGTTTRRNGLARRDAYGETQAPRYVSFRSYLVRPGDSITGIAFREMGDATAWQDLALVNGLIAPFVSEVRMPRVASPGDEIQIPLTDARAAAVASPPDDDAVSAALGVDFYLGADRRWAVDETTGTSLKMVRGVACFAQALERLRLVIQLGTDMLFPSLGILTPIGSPNGIGMADLVTVGARRAVLADRRTEAVTRIESRDLGDGVSVELDVVPSGYGSGVSVQVAQGTT